jgi:hypothetical protein
MSFDVEMPYATWYNEALSIILFDGLVLTLFVLTSSRLLHFRKLILLT